MNRSSTHATDTRAAQAALNRPTTSELTFDHYLLVDDSDEDLTQILTVVTEQIGRASCRERV